MSRFIEVAPHRVGKRPFLSTFKRHAAALAFICLSACAMEAKADPSPIVLGVLSFDSLIPDAPGAVGVNGFTIYNFTGANSLPGTPDSAISFLNASLLLNGTQGVNVGEVDPGSVQPLNLQFPTTSLFTDAEFSAMLSTTSFTIDGENYVASSDMLTAVLVPSSPPELAAGTDFVLLEVDASPATVGVPETGSLWMMLMSAVSIGLAFLCRRSKSIPV
jgi:hypothetical protein